MQQAICNMQCVICSRQYAICNQQYATCKVQSAICNKSKHNRLVLEAFCATWCDMLLGFGFVPQFHCRSGVVWHPYSNVCRSSAELCLMCVEVTFVSALSICLNVCFHTQATHPSQTSRISYDITNPICVLNT